METSNIDAMLHWYHSGATSKGSEQGKTGYGIDPKLFGM